MLSKTRWARAAGLALAILLAASSVSASAASGNFLYRYKMNSDVVVTDPTGPTPPVSCDEDDTCSSDPCANDSTGGVLNGFCDADSFPDHVVVPTANLIKGADATSYWFPTYYGNAFWGDPSKEMVLVSGTPPAGVTIEPGGWVDGTAMEVGTKRVVYDVWTLDDNGDRVKKVTDITYRFNVTSIPAHIVAPTKNYFVGDRVDQRWFATNYSNILWHPNGYDIAINVGDSQFLMGVDSAGDGTLTGKVTQEGTMVVKYDIFVIDADGNDGMKVSDLTETITAQPNLHVAELVTETSPGVYPIADLDNQDVYFDPNSSYRDLVTQGGGNDLAGAVIVGLQQNDCSSVTWSIIPGEQGTPKYFELSHPTDGVSLFSNTPPEVPYYGYEYYEYTEMRLEADCKDSAGKVMIRYLTTNFSIHLPGLS